MLRQSIPKNSFVLQEYIFRLEPGKVDSGKGKCPYDPKLNSVSALISEFLHFYLKYIFLFKKRRNICLVFIVESNFIK